MREETFFEHCLRRLEAGDTREELQNLLEQACNQFEGVNTLSKTEVKSIKEINFALRAKKSWETRRKNQESAELEAKEIVIPK